VSLICNHYNSSPCDVFAFLITPINICSLIGFDISGQLILTGYPIIQWFRSKKENVLITVFLKETGWGGMGWTNMDQNRAQWQTLVNRVMNLQVLGNS
jgi:hypothetical protein